MECISPRYLPLRDMSVPCGHCAFCGATRRSDWATRLHYEKKLWYGCSFVTLTYSTNNLTYVNNRVTLVRADLQQFFKRLRKSGNVFRYYAVGEYGSKTSRPHYHIILFGEVQEAAIRQAWSRYSRRTHRFTPLGIVHIGTVTQESIAYCLGYLVGGRKGIVGSKRHQRSFSLMSKGMGKNYLSPAMIEWHRSGRKNYVLLDGAKRHLPRYYKDKIFSKLDKVRIAVAAEKAYFQRMLRFIRDPKRMKMRDPLGYWDDCQRQLARNIVKKSKLDLLI